MSLVKNSPVTMRMIADKIGVTHATVSLALRNDPRIPLKRREEVCRVALQMGYIPDPLLSQLATYRKSSTGVRIQSVLAWFINWEQPDDFYLCKEFNLYYEGACAMADKLGYHLEIFNPRKDNLTPNRLGGILAARSIRGIIIPPHPVIKVSSDDDWPDFCVVRIGFSQPYTRRHVVGSDQYQGGRLAAKGMLDAGYRRIGFVTDEHLEEVSRDNFSSGFQSVRNKLVPAKAQIPDLVLQSQEQSDACDLYGRWLIRHKVDAVLFRVDKVPAWTKALGYKIGSDLGLAGTSYHDSGVDSGIDQNPYEIGSVAVQYLSSLIAHHEFGLPSISQRLLITPAWVAGTSLASDRNKPISAQAQPQLKGSLAVPSEAHRAKDGAPTRNRTAV